MLKSYKITEDFNIYRWEWSFNACSKLRVLKSYTITEDFNSDRWKWSFNACTKLWVLKSYKITEDFNSYWQEWSFNACSKLWVLKSYKITENFNSYWQEWSFNACSKLWVLKSYTITEDMSKIMFWHHCYFALRSRSKVKGHGSRSNVEVKVISQGKRSGSNFWRAAVDIRGSALPSAAKSNTAGLEQRRVITVMERSIQVQNWPLELFNGI